MAASRSRLAVIFLTVLIDLIGFGIILPILPYYAQRFGAQGLGFGVVVSAYSLMQFLATAVLGRIADRVGRRPVLLATMVINMGGYLLFAFAGSYEMLLLSRIICGIGGGNISAAQAYVADITTPAERSRGMGMIGAAFGLGFVIGPAIGGLAGHAYGPAAPGLVAAGLSLLNLGSAFFILTESLAHEHRTRRKLLDFAHLAEAYRRPALRPLMIIWGLLPFAFSGYTVALPLYAGMRWGWGARELGIFFVVVGVTAAVSQGYLFGKIVKRLGERTCAQIGTFGMAISVLVVPALSSEHGLYAWTVVLAFSNSLASPALTGLVSVYAGPAEQGTVLGASQSTSALGRLAGPSAFGLVYDAASPVSAFVAAAGVMLVGGLVSLELAPLPDGGHSAVAGATPSPPA